ncbi:MAG: GGDEF domain-containing protein [Pseudomonadota bacterium]
MSGVEPSHRLAEIALGALKKIGLSATPRNFEVWFAHAEGKNPSLSRAIQAASDAFGKVEQRQADELYRRHIQQADLSRNVVDLVARFHEEVENLHEMIEESGETASGNSETLGELSDQLRQSSEEYPAVGALLEGVFSVARDMRTQNEILESRLAESATEISSLQRNVEHIQAEAMKDPLTGVANRALFDRSLEQQMAAARVTNEPLTLVLADIDHFKKFNDTWGHQTGDQVLRLVAEVMDANIKGQDILARYGGEEFAIILPDTTVENARSLADKIRSAVESRHLKKRRTGEDLGVVTMSMGVASFRQADDDESFIERVDECLYAAKENGRNQVVDEQELDKGSKKTGAA